MKKETMQISSKDDPFELDPTDRQILKCLVDFPLTNNVEIGKKIGVHPNTVSNRRKKPAFVKAYADLNSTTDDLLERAQKMAARRLLSFIKDPDKKFALDAMKVALSQRSQKKEIQVKEEIVFQTRVGSQGQLMQEVIEVDKKHILDTSPTETNEAQGESTDTPNGKQDKT
jgi:hypothetical protein